MHHLPHATLDRGLRFWTAADSVSRLHKASGQHMLAKAAQELDSGESHDALFIAMGIVFPSEAHAVPIEVEQALIADGDAVGIAAEIAQHASRLLSVGAAATDEDTLRWSPGPHGRAEPESCAGPFPPRGNGWPSYGVRCEALQAWRCAHGRRLPCRHTKRSCPRWVYPGRVDLCCWGSPVFATPATIHLRSAYC